MIPKKRTKRERDGEWRRRDAMKMMGIGGAAAFMGVPPSSEAAVAQAGTLKSDKKVKIVVVGAGAGGLMALSRLRRALPNAQITVIAPNEKHIYQPGQVFMAAGLYTFDDIVKDNKDFIPDDVTWIKDVSSLSSHCLFNIIQFHGICLCKVFSFIDLDYKIFTYIVLLLAPLI